MRTLIRLLAIRSSVSRRTSIAVALAFSSSAPQLPFAAVLAGASDDAGASAWHMTLVSPISKTSPRFSNTFSPGSSGRPMSRVPVVLPRSSSSTFPATCTQQCVRETRGSSIGVSLLSPRPRRIWPFSGSFSFQLFPPENPSKTVGRRARRRSS
jgi:hypothetical protein